MVPEKTTDKKSMTVGYLIRHFDRYNPYQDIHRDLCVCASFSDETKQSYIDALRAYIDHHNDTEEFYGYAQLAYIRFTTNASNYFTVNGVPCFYIFSGEIEVIISALSEALDNNMSKNPEMDRWLASTLMIRQVVHQQERMRRFHHL